MQPGLGPFLSTGGLRHGATRGEAFFLKKPRRSFFLVKAYRRRHVCGIQSERYRGDAPEKPRRGRLAERVQHPIV